MVYAGGACIVSKSEEALEKMMTALATLIRPEGITVSEKKTETMLLRTPNEELRTSPIIIAAAPQG